MQDCMNLEFCSTRNITKSTSSPSPPPPRLAKIGYRARPCKAQAFSYIQWYTQLLCTTRNTSTSELSPLQTQSHCDVMSDAYTSTSKMHATIWQDNVTTQLAKRFKVHLIINPYPPGWYMMSLSIYSHSKGKGPILSIDLKAPHLQFCNVKYFWALVRCQKICTDGVIWDFHV